VENRRRCTNSRDENLGLVVAYKAVFVQVLVYGDPVHNLKLMECPCPEVSLCSYFSLDASSLSTLNRNMIYLTSDNFDAEILKKDVKALVLFAPDWSTAGNKIAVAMEALGKPVFRVDIDKSADLAMRFSIRQSPYLILFEQGFAIDSAVELTDAMLKQMSS
jgi:hypothetical protein